MYSVGLALPCTWIKGLTQNLLESMGLILWTLLASGQPPKLLPFYVPFLLLPHLTLLLSAKAQHPKDYLGHEGTLFSGCP